VLNGLHKEAHQLGRLVGHKASFQSWHFSINNAGSFNSTVSQGGKSAEMLRDLLPWLHEEVKEGEKEDTPFGCFTYFANGERWSQLFRNPTDVVGEFREEYYNVIEDFVPVRKEGIDSALTKQIYTLAWKTSERYGPKDPIPTRIAPVPEPGGKVRVISMAPWWLGVILAPMGHYIQDLLKKDLDGCPCLWRKSPAWDCYCRMQGLYHDESRHSWLFSDMKACTDYFPKELARGLLTHFLAGAGVLIDDGLRHVIDIATSPRDAVFPDGSTKLINRGILMGENLTKSILTIYMCSLRNLSIFSFLRKREYPRWFLFHIGGDDHLVHGPRVYLRYLTDLNMRAGFMISNSHMITDIGGLYLQVPFYFQGVDLSDHQAVYHRYHLSPYCDYIKPRLLSPCGKPQSLQNETNVSIGKAKALAKALTYFPDRVLQSIYINRFIFRHENLPRRSNPRTSEAYHMIFLPEPLGGLGLGDIGDVHLNKAPSPIKLFMYRLMTGEATIREQMVIRRFTMPTKTLKLSYERERVIEHLQGLVIDKQDLPKVDWSYGFVNGVDQLEKLGYYTLENFLGLIDRQETFKLQIEGAKLHHLSISWPKRLEALWTDYVIGCGLEAYYNESKHLIRSMTYSWPLLKEKLKDVRSFINTNKDVVHYWYNDRFGELVFFDTIYKGYLWGTPSLHLNEELVLTMDEPKVRVPEEPLIYRKDDIENL
jgi:hypothetical protein